MQRIKVLARCMIVSFALLTVSAPAAADDIRTILQFLSNAKIIDPKIVDASELIRCFAEHSPEKCVGLQQSLNDLKSEASSAAEKKAAEFVPDDPMVRAAVDVVRAVIKEDWLRVLELAGVQLLGQVACAGSLAVTGPLQPFICGEFSSAVLDNVEPVVHEVLVVVRDFPNVNIWNMVTLLGFDLACDIVKGQGVPFASEACGILGAAVEAIKDLGKAAAKVLQAGAETISDAATAIMGGGGSDMSMEQIYNLQFRPLMYKHTLQRLVQNRQNLGFDSGESLDCLKSLGPYCSQISQKLQNESEALVKLVQAMPETYANGFLADEVRAFAVRRRDMGSKLLNYVSKLPVQDWEELISGNGVYLMASYTGLPDSEQAQLKDLWKDCRFWVNERLTGSGNYGVPTYPNIAPSSLANWICFKGAAQLFSQALVKEDKRLAAVSKGLNTLGCQSLPGLAVEFNCQSHISFSICVNQSYKDYGENRYCKADRDKTAESLGISLINALGETRCRYIALSKGNFGDFDPRVQCSRPWKQETCDVLLTSFRAKFEVPSSRMKMRCAYAPDKEFLAQEARAKEILAVLNKGPAPGMARASGSRNIEIMSDPKSCKTLWDPLAINCPHQTTMPELSGDLASPAIASCPADPNKNGADRVCYQTVFTAADSNREIFENQTLSPASTTPQNLSPPTAGPARSANVSRPPVPSPIAPGAEATTALPGSAAASVPQMTTRSGLPAGQPETTTAPARTEAPAIRAMNAQQGAPQAPPNPCRMDVAYYVPRPPVIESSSPSLQVGDQVQIQCGFEQRTRQLEWPQCDDEAKRAMESFKFSQESGSRYSGMMIVDDANVSLATSPVEGGNFDNTGTWLFNAAGAHQVICQVDNGLHVAGSDSPVHLRTSVSVRVGVRSDAQEFRAFEPGMARRVPTTSQPAQVAPLASDGRMRLGDAEVSARGNDSLINPALNPQPEVPSSRQPGGNDLVNPSLNPQPEVPSSKQPGGNDLVNPSLNPQPEVPSSKQPGGNDLVNPSLNPQPEVPSRKLEEGTAIINEQATLIQEKQQ